MTICAYCGKFIREEPEGKVSHGICKECYDEQIRKIEDQNKDQDEGKTSPLAPLQRGEAMRRITALEYLEYFTAKTLQKRYGKP